MKHAIISVMLLLVSLNLYAQIFEPDRPMIMPFVVSVDSINAQMHDSLKKPNHDKLSINGGWVMIPNTYYRHNGKSLGIIIVQDFTYTYHAYDLRCPHCFYDNDIATSKMTMQTHMSAMCYKCNAQAENIVCWGSGQMTCYDHGNLGPRYMDGYSVNIIKKGRKIYLRIANNPNGAYDEWRELPENRFLIGADAFGWIQ